MQYRFENGEILKIDTENLPRGDDLDRVYQCLMVNDAPPDLIKDMAYLYRKDFDVCSMLLDLALEHCHLESIEKKKAQNIFEDIKIETVALMMNHKRDPRDLFNDLDYVQNKKLDLLKAFYLLSKGETEDALFLFNKVSHRIGIELCHLKMGRHEEASMSSDFRVRCYADSREWSKAHEKNIKNRDFLFRIGFSEEYSDETNSDVKLEKIKRNLKGIENKIYKNDYIRKLMNKGDKAPEGLEEAIEQLKLLDKSGEALYLLGKSYHLQNDHEKAIFYYKQALNQDSKYLPAHLNLRRIEGESINLASFNKNAGYSLNKSSLQAIHDYRALYSISKGEFSIDFSECSDRVRRLCGFIVNSRSLQNYEMLEKIVYSKILNRDPGHLQCASQESSEYLQLFNPVVLLNNLGVLYSHISDSQDLAAEVLERALKYQDPAYNEIIRYNLGVVTKNLDALKESSFLEAQEQISLIKSDASAMGPVLKAFVLLGSDRNAAREILEDFLVLQSKNSSKDSVQLNQNVFAGICLGSIYIEDYISSVSSDGTGDVSILNKAISIFRANLNSPFCVNGLAVCYCIKGFTFSALSMFNQIRSDYDESAVNSFYCFLVSGEYEKACDTLSKYKRKEEHFSFLTNLCRRVRDPGLVAAAIKCGVTGLEELKKDLEKELCSAVFDDDRVDKEEERRRKIAEIEDYRKKRKLD